MGTSYGEKRMKILYSSKKLEKILTNPRLLKRYYSNDYSRIMNRLSELKAANSLAEIPTTPPPRRHKLKGELSGKWGIDYSANHRIVLCPAGKYDINDLSTITEIIILSLEDYH